MNTLSLGTKIKSLRKRKGMTQKELAEAIPTSFSTFRRWENDMHTPNLKEISRIAEVLNVNANEFIENDINSDEAIHLKTKISQVQYPSMSYWGEVVDNMRNLAQSGNLGEISLIYTLLKSGYEKLANVIALGNSTDNVN